MKLSIIPAGCAPYTLSVFRIAVGLLFLEHGTGKLFNFPPIADAMEKMMGVGMLNFTGFVELIGGLLIVLGLLTRIVAFVLSGFMAVGYLMAHLPNGFFPVLNFGEAAALYSFAFLYLAAAGPGPWSVDRG
jgi:putative oxidoreductase